MRFRVIATDMWVIWCLDCQADSAELALTQLHMRFPESARDSRPLVMNLDGPRPSWSSPISWNEMSEEWLDGHAQEYH